MVLLLCNYDFNSATSYESIKYMSAIQKILLLFGIGLTFSLSALGASSTWTFKSSLDSFRLQQKGAHFYYGKKKVSAETFEPFLDFFRKSFETECPGDLNKADIVITHKTQKIKTTRSFYIQQRIIEDENHGCLQVEGNGLFFLPLHKSWFIGKKKDSLKIKDEFEVWQGNKKIIVFKKQKEEWLPADPTVFHNAIFLNKFLNSVTNFPIDARLFLGMVQDMEPGLTVKTSNKEYLFYHLPDGKWVLKSPKTQWLIASSAWAFWSDLSEDIWFDARHPLLSQVANPSLPLKVRKKALLQLQSSWTPAIKRAFQQRLLDPKDSEEFKKMVLYQLRQHPSIATMKVLVKALRQTSSPDLQYFISKTLRIRNPKGPLIKEEMSEEERKKALLFWEKWASQAKD
ncbi:MAG: hypothetical protein D6797_01345 [Bdellovibrio sp.]|nr:MAG: hypothetical protein D6797_01345 [Bdellovibrio sp.]